MKVYLNSVRQQGPICADGTRSIVIGEESTCIYEGDAMGAIDVLKAVGIGQSVAVRHAGGLRSCMNKPDLWNWCENQV